MVDWKTFFQGYRIIDIKGDADLLFQVGATVGGKPVSREQFDTIILSIEQGLKLSDNDSVLDLCCGNGVITFEIAKKAKKVVGIDSSKPYIDNAVKFKSAENISYLTADVTDTDKIIEACPGKLFNKAYCYASIAYLLPGDLEKLFLLFNKISGANFSFMLGSVLDRQRKWHFFNTFRRRVHYLIGYKLLGRDFGVGRWWTKKEIETIAKRHKYICRFIEQDKSLHTAHYRFDAVISKAGTDP